MANIVVTIFNDPVTSVTEALPGRGMRMTGGLLYQEITKTETVISNGMVFRGTTSLEKAREITRGIEDMMSS